MVIKKKEAEEREREKINIGYIFELSICLHSHLTLPVAAAMIIE